MTSPALTDEQNGNATIRQLIKYFKNKHSELLFKSQTEIREYINFFIENGLRRPSNLSDEDWDTVKYITYVFAVVFNMDPADFPKINLIIQDGYLFSASLMLKTDNKTAHNKRYQIYALFKVYLNRVSNGFNASNFYSVTFCYYMLSIPHFIRDSMNMPHFSHYLNTFFSIMANLSKIPNSLNYSNLLFISETLKSSEEAGRIHSIECISAFTNLFRDTIHFPSSSLFLYFKPWMMSIRKMSKDNFNRFFPKQMEYVIEMFDEISKNKYQELNSSFPWSLVLFMDNYIVDSDKYRQQMILINSLSNVIRHVSYLEQLPYMGDAIQRFSEQLKTSYEKKGAQCHLLTMLTALQQSMSSLKSVIKKLKPIAVVGEGCSPPSEKVYFIDQISAGEGTYDYDKELFTHVTYKCFSTYEEADKFHKKQLLIADDIRGKFNTIVFFFFQLMPRIAMIYSQKIKQKNNTESSILFHYIVSFTESWIDLIFLASYHYLCIDLYKPNDTSDLSYSNPEEICNLDFKTIFNKVMVYINGLVSVSYRTIASLIVNKLDEYHKNNMITVAGITVLDKLPHSIQSEAGETKTIFAHLVALMMSHAYEEIHNLNTRSFEQSESLYRWSLLTMRIGKPKNQKLDSFFGSLILFYFKVIVTSIFTSTRWTTNQGIALKTAQAYIDAENEVHPELPQTIGRNSRMNLRIISFDDIRDSARFQASSAFLDFFQSECDPNSLAVFMPAFAAAFNSGNPSLIAKATLITHKFIVGGLPNKWNVTESEAKRNYFTMYFNALGSVTKEAASKILNDIPLLTPLFLREPQSTFNHFMNANIEELNFNLTIIMQQVSMHAKEDEDDYRNIFALLTNCFDYIQRNILAESQHILPIIRYAVNLLCQCFAYDSIYNTVRSYAAHLNDVFVPPFARGDFDLYFLCLLGVIGDSRSEIAQIASDLAICFLKTSKEYGTSEHAVKKTVASFLAMFSSHKHIFSCLTGLSLFNRFFPGSIILDYVRSLLVQLTDIPASETHFFTILNQFLKNYLAIQTPEMKMEFVQMVYDVICPLTTSVRIILLKRLDKLNVTLPIHSWSEIYTQDTILFIQRVTLVYTCGAEFDFKITKEILDRILDFYVHKPSHISILEHFARILQMTLAILPHKESLIVFINNEMIISQFLNLICNSFTSHYKPVLNLAKKVITKMKRMYSGELYFSQQIYDYCQNPEEIFEPFGSQPERIRFYRKLIKYLPDKVSVNVIDIFTNSFVEYEKMTNLQKIQYMPNCIQFIKSLTVRELMDIEEVYKRMTEVRNGKSNLQIAIDVFLKLAHNPEVPFIALTKKDIVKFTCIFAEPTVQYICFSQNVASAISLNLFTMIIENDRSLVILNALNKQFMAIEDLMTIHPSIFSMLRSLSNNKQIVALPEFQQMVTRSFSFFSVLCNDYDKPGDGRLGILVDVLHAMVKIIEITKEIETVFEIANVFTQPILLESNIYHLFIDVCFHSQDDHGKEEIFEIAYSRRERLDPNIFGLILVHCITKSSHCKSVILSFWDKIIDIATEDCALRPIIRIMYHLSKRCFPPNKQIVKIFMGPLKRAMSSQDPDTLVYAIRLSTNLLKADLMSPKVFYGFSSMLLSYRKFLEYPYGKYVAEFIKEGLPIVETRSKDYIKTLTYFFHDRNMTIDDYIKIGEFFLLVPELMDYIPISFAGFMISLFKNSKGQKLSGLFVFLFKFFSRVQTTFDEFQMYADASFEYLSKFFSQPAMKHDISDNFYMLLSKSPHKIRSTYKLFHLIHNYPLSSHSFGFVCISMKYISDEEILLVKDIILLAIKYFDDQKNYVNTKLLSIFTDRLFSNKKNWEIYGKEIIAALDKMLDNYNEVIAERVLILIYSIINAHINIEPEFNRLFTFIDEFCIKEPYNSSSHLLIQYIIKCIEKIHFRQQPGYIDLLIEKIKQSKECIRSYSGLLSHLFLSKSISPVSKESISEIFPFLIKDLDAQTIKNSITIISQEKVNFTFLLRLNLVLAKQANPSLRIVTLDSIRSMLPEDSTEAIVVLFDVLKPEYWTNEFVPLIVALVAKKVHFWQPLFALSSYFEKIGSELVWATFQQIITEANVSAFRQFYTLMVSQKSLGKFSSIINGISRAFLFKRLPLPSETVQTAASNTGEFDTLSTFINPDSVATQYLLPHRVNDTVYGLVRPKLSLRESSAMALTLLNQYGSAESLYREDESPLIQRVHTINTSFLAGVNIMYHNSPTIEEIMLPLLDVNSNPKEGFEVTSLAAKLIKEGHNEKAKELLHLVEDKITNTILGNKFISIYNKERISVMMNLVLYLKQLASNKSPIKFDSMLDEESEFHCMNHVFKQILYNFVRFMTNQPPLKRPEETGGDMLFFAAKSYGHSFSSIVGRNSRGLIAIGEDQIRCYFDSINSKIQDKTIDINGLIKYAPFCYNCYCIQPTISLFKSAFVAYTNIFSSGEQMPIYVKHEAATRIITLVRYVINNENHPEEDLSGEDPREYIEFIQSFSNIFSSENALLWCFWLQQIVELSRSKWFFNMACSLFNDMSYRSTLYGTKFGIPYFSDIMHKKVMQDNVSTQIVMMNLLLKFFDTTLSLNFNDYSRMKKIYRFAQELSKLTPEQAYKTDFFALRAKTAKSAVTQLEKSLSMLTQKEIENIDFHCLYQLSQNKDNTELMQYIQEISGSQDSYDKYTEIIDENVMELNKNLPFIFSIIFDEIPHISIIRVHEDISILSENIFLIHATTATSPRVSFLIQQTSEIGEFHPSVMTLSNLILFFRNMMRSCYQSRTRGIQLQASHSFEVGTELVLVYLPSEPVSLEELFIKSTMKTQSEWIEENIVDGELTEEGKENAKLFDPRVFQTFMLTEMAQTPTSNIRINLLHSFAASHIVRELLSAAYPTLGHTFLCYQAALLPMIYIDFNDSTKRIGEDREYASSRLSPNIINSMGFTWRGEYIISLSSCAQALISNIESVRAFFELYAGDLFINNHSIQNIRTKAENIENILTALAPPSIENCPEEVCTGWLQDVENFINKACTTENQPYYAIPWF